MGRRILIVDDEPDVTTYLSLVLKQYGFTPLVATSADQARDLIATEKPDLICLDIMMPKRSGFSFYSDLRQMTGFSDTPVVVISGIVQAGEFDFRQFVPDESIPPPQHYLEKPIDVDQFIALLKKLVPDRKKSGTAKGRG